MRVDVGEVQRLDGQKKLVKVLEIEERQQIEKDANGKQAPAPRGALGCGANGVGHQVIDQDGANQKKDVELVPCSVKHHGHCSQPGNDRTPAVAPKQVETQHGDRQKDEYEPEGVEEHRGS